MPRVLNLHLRRVASALVLAQACTSQVGPDEQSTNEERTTPELYSVAVTVSSVSRLPSCTVALGGTTAQVLSPLTLWTCFGGSWAQVPCTRIQGGAVAY